MKGQNSLKITAQTEAIKYFIEKMDIDMIALILKDELTYQDFNKDIFISKMKILFYEFIESGDTLLISIPGQCGTCYKDKSGYTFIGNKSFNYISILFDNDKGEIKDLFECSNFKRTDNTARLNKRLFIDKPELPFL